jgi:hypothetical protein
MDAASILNQLRKSVPLKLFDEACEVEKRPVRRSIQMTPAGAADWLERGHNLALATIGSDGYPHLVAMSYAVDNGDIVMTSYRKERKSSICCEMGMRA